MAIGMARITGTLTPRRDYVSWGGMKSLAPEIYSVIHSSDGLTFLNEKPGPFLPYAYGRSYGDSCLNDVGALIDTSHIDRTLIFNSRTGILRAEAGTPLAAILDLIVPKGWFLPVVPGTKTISLGGAIANDVHGKNHHSAGTFGSYVKSFELARSDRGRVICSAEENPDYFRATIGGLGLTGLVTWAEIELIPIPSAFVDIELVKFNSLEEYLELSMASDARHPYTVSWLDCSSSGSRAFRGVFMRGDFKAFPGEKNAFPLRSGNSLSLPFGFPSRTIGKWATKAFNFLYFAKHSKMSRKRMHFDRFFFPLDRITNWNLLYGKSGFSQYQCIIPFEAIGAVRELHALVRASRTGSSLVVLKNFGSKASPGMLSFPRPGITLALDFANHGEKTQRLFRALDEVVARSGGRLYPAKDGRMPAEIFQQGFPVWKDFTHFIDPKFSSNLWRRVSREENSSHRRDVEDSRTRPRLVRAR